MSEQIIKAACALISLGSVGSCGCKAKSGLSMYHEKECRFKYLAEAIELLETIDASPQVGREAVAWLAISPTGNHEVYLDDPREDDEMVDLGYIFHPLYDAPSPAAVEPAKYTLTKSERGTGQSEESFQRQQQAQSSIKEIISKPAAVDPTQCEWCVYEPNNGPLIEVCEECSNNAAVDPVLDLGRAASIARDALSKETSANLNLEDSLGKDGGGAAVNADTLSLTMLKGSQIHRELLERYSGAEGGDD
jgi:hypothetical protein